MSLYIRYPVDNVPTRPTFADFPASALDGFLMIALDTHVLYEYNALTTTWRPIAGPGSVTLGMGAFDGQPPSPNGASITGGQLFMQSATATDPGEVNTGAQTFAGVKTFNAAPNFASLTASLPLQLDASKNVISAPIDLATQSFVPLASSLYVDKNRADTYVEDGSISRPFKTIMAAVNQIITNGDNTPNFGYLIDIVGGGIYTENIILESLNLQSLVFDGHGDVSIAPASGLSVQSTLNNNNLVRCFWYGIEFDSDITMINTVNDGILGAFGINYYNCTVDGSGTITYQNLKQSQFVNCSTGNLSLTNCVSIALIGGVQGSSLTLVTDLGQPQPDGFFGTFIACRYCNVGSNVTVDSGSFFFIYQGSVLGFQSATFINNGFCEFFGSQVNADITNNASGTLILNGTWYQGALTNSGSFTNNNNLRDDSIAANANIAVSKLAAGTDTYVLTSVSGVPTWEPSSSVTTGNLTDVGTDGIVITGGIGAVVGSGTSIAQHVADTTHNGYLSSTDWNTFNSKQPALTLGNLTDAGTDGITVTGGTGAVVGTGTSLSQHVADTTHNGYLSSTDWNTFNSKQAAGNYITALTGDVTASGPGSAAATIAAGAVTAAKLGTVTDGVTLDQSGAGATLEVKAGGIANTQVSATAAIAFSKLASLTSAHILVGSAGNVATDTAVSGDISLTNAGVTAYSGTVPINKGGTGQTTQTAAFDALSPMTAGGDLIYGGASGTGTRLANGTAGQVLTSQGTTLAPKWATAGTGTVTGPVSSTNNAIAVWNGTGGTAIANSAVLINSTGIVGSDGTADAVAGNIGEYVESVVSTATSMTAASGAFQDATSISLTAGDWDISFSVQFSSQASASVTELTGGISTTTGNSSTGLVNGSNRLTIDFITGLGTGSGAFVNIPVYRQRFTGTTTYFGKILAAYITTAPKFQCRLSARRVR